MYHLDSKVKVYDIEVFPNCFLCCFVDKTTKNIDIFAIHESQNDLLAFVEYIEQLKGLIGYNNLSFDSQVIQFIYENVKSGEWEFFSVSEITYQIYVFSQKEINKQGLGKSWLTYSEKDLLVSQLDLMRIWHFTNVARTQSLKGLQCNLNYERVQECSIHFDKFISKEELIIVIEYCKNDILSTLAFLELEKTREKIELRRSLIKQYGLPKFAFNWSDPKIGEELMLKFYCELTNKDKWTVKKQRTERTEVALKECIPDNVKFITPDFQHIKDIFENTTLLLDNNFRMKKSPSVYYRGLQYDFGVGGIHASDTGVFESDDENIIIDVDVGSMYPNIAISNGYYPEHLGPKFVKVYKDRIVNVRMKEKRKPKAERDIAIIEGFKLAANSVYGKSNDRFSFLYDPKYTFSTTITGQLQLAMLAETICETIKSSKIIQANTDGITVRLNRKDVEEFRLLCKEWENKVKLELEEIIYKKMYIRDVNNYCAVPEKGDVKLKGCFEKDKDLHKDPSARIVPIALEKYIVDGIPVEETIRNHTSIWDFLLRVKFKRTHKGEFHYIENGKHKIDSAEKVARYYVANRGKTFLKMYLKDGEVAKKEKVEAGWLTLEANHITNENAFDYDINYRYYIERARKIIDAVEKPQNQLGLFG